MPINSDLSRWVTAPGVPSPIVQPPDVPSTAPTGVITAAVPQAKTSVSSPAAQPSRQAVTETRPPSARVPGGGATFSTEALVVPGRSEPASAGVSAGAESPRPYTQ